MLKWSPVVPISSQCTLVYYSPFAYVKVLTSPYLGVNLSETIQVLLVIFRPTRRTVCLIDHGMVQHGWTVQPGRQACVHTVEQNLQKLTCEHSYALTYTAISQKRLLNVMLY